MSASARWSLVLSAMAHLVATAALAATFTVDSTLDQSDDDIVDGLCHTPANTCTLRAAIMQANALAEGSTIYLPAGTYTLTRPPVGANGIESGDLNFETPEVNNPVIDLVGAGSESTIVDGNQLDSVFTIESGRRANLSNLTIRNGLAQQGGGAVVFGPSTFTRVVVRDNTAIDGAGVFATSPDFRLVEGTIRDNQAAQQAGGLMVIDHATLDRSTVSGNSAANGGGVFVHLSSDLRVIESTVSSNRATFDGGGVFVYSLATVNVYSSTIVFNAADSDQNDTGDAGGLENFNNLSTVNIRNCLIAGNYIAAPFDPDDCVGTINSYGRNLFEDVAGCSVVTGSGSWDLLNDLGTIGPLGKHGGPTQTHELFPGSNAIDGGDPVNGCLSPTGVLTVDQRGMGRVGGVRCDVGAYEEGVLFADGFEPGDLSAWPSASSG